MSDRSDQVVALLRSIDASLKALLNVRSGGGAAAAEVASDRDLDDPKYGDPEVKFNPRDWQGDSQKGKRMSECPAEFLDLLAGTFDYFARKAEESGEQTTSGKPVAPYKRKDAARARGWAARIRRGWRPVSEGGFEAAGDWPDDQPF